jgi:hypothetical protein
MFTGGAPNHPGQKNAGDAYFVKVLAPAGALRRRAQGHFHRKGRARTLTIIATAVLLLPAVVASSAFLAFGGGRSHADTRTYSLFSPTDAPATVASDSNASANDWGSVELGMKFSPNVDGYATGVEFFKGAGNNGTHVGTLWERDGTKLAQVTFTDETDSGWQRASFSPAVALSAGKKYTVSYHASQGHYAYTHWYFKRSIDNGTLTAPASRDRDGNGVYNYGSRVSLPTLTWKASNYWVDVTFTTSAPSAGVTVPVTDPQPTTAPTSPTTNAPGTTTAPTTAAPSTTTVPRTTTTPPTSPPTTAAPPTTVTTPTTVPTTPPPSGGFPNASNTGVVSGTSLSTYTGPLTITSCGTVIDSKIVNGDLEIRAGNGTHSASTPCVTIRNSFINGEVHNGYGSQGRGPLVLSDTEIAVPIPNDGASAGLDQANFYGWRLDIHGARSGVQCDGWCELHDSFVHGNYYVSPAHMDAFISNGSYGRPMVLDHNSFQCQMLNPGASDGNGGCSADVGFFADFSAITNVTVTNNLMMASSDSGYCAYTGTYQPSKPYPVGTGIVWTNNVWQKGSNGKCGWAGSGAVYDWQTNAGSAWCNNTWDSGAAVLPSVPCVKP